MCSLAADTAGTILNINADTVAARIAVAIQAAKYFLVTNVDGVLRDRRDPATLQSYLDLEQLAELIRCGAIQGGMLPKLAACTEALRGGVEGIDVKRYYPQAFHALLCELEKNGQRLRADALAAVLLFHAHAEHGDMAAAAVFSPNLAGTDYVPVVLENDENLFLRPHVVQHGL
jgi:glutamate 5-kinase